MADAATVVMKTTVLPDEIAKTIEATTTVSPKDANDKWYYKLPSVSASSTDLMAGYYTDYTAVDDDTAPTAITTSDKVKFLFVQNTSSADGVYLVLDGGTAANDVVDGIFIGPSETFCARLPNTTVGNLHAISSDIADAGDATANLIVCALIDDVA